VRFVVDDERVGVVERLFVDLDDNVTGPDAGLIGRSARRD
jgi:hypothetical protein